MTKNKESQASAPQASDETTKPARDTRAFFERENLTRAEWIKIARVVDLRTINPAEVKSYVVVNAMLADASKDQRMTWARAHAPFADVLLTDSSEDVVAAATLKASDDHIMFALAESKCMSTKKSIKHPHMIARTINPLRRSGRFQVAMLEKFLPGKSPYGTYIQDQVSHNSVTIEDMSGLLAKITAGEIPLVDSDTFGQLVQVIRNMGAMDDTSAGHIANIIRKCADGQPGNTRLLLGTLVGMAKSGILSDAHLVTFVEAAGDVGPEASDGLEMGAYFALSSMIASDDRRKKALAALEKRAAKAPQGGETPTYNDAYTFLRLDDGSFERLFRTAESLSGLALMAMFETMKASLIRQATILGESYEGQDDENIREDPYRVMTMFGASSSYYYRRRSDSEVLDSTPHELGLVPEAAKAKDLSTAAKAILDSEGWQALAVRTLRGITNLMASEDFMKRLGATPTLRLFVTNVLKLVGMERAADHEEVERLLREVGLRLEESERLSRHNMTDSDFMTDTAMLKLTESLVGDTGDRLTAVMYFIQNRAANEKFIHKLLERLTTTEILKIVRINKIRLKNDIARKIAESLSVEEFYMMLLDENLSIKMLAYQIAHYFIGKRLDADGNMASVKELVKIVISGGAVGDKELNAHVAMLCDVGADLSTVAMASHVYRMLSLGGDVEMSDEELLEIAKNVDTLADITNPHARKLIVSKAKGDKDFLKRLQQTNGKLWSEVKSLPLTSGHSEVATFIKDLIFDRQSSLMDYANVDEELLGWYAKNILSLVPREKRKDFFFHDIGASDNNRNYLNGMGGSNYVLRDAMTGITKLQDDVDVEGNHRSAEMKREFVLSALATALQGGGIEISPKAIHDFIASQNKKLKTGNVLLFSVENPHKAYRSVLRTSGVSFSIDEDEYNAKIITTSHDKQDWGDELSFCVGNESFTQRARTGRYFYLGVVKQGKDGRPKKDGVIEIRTIDQDSGKIEYVMGDAKHAHNRPMGGRLIAKLVEMFNEALAEVHDEPTVELKAANF